MKIGKDEVKSDAKISKDDDIRQEKQAAAAPQGKRSVNESAPLPEKRLETAEPPKPKRRQGQSKKSADNDAIPAKNAKSRKGHEFGDWLKKTLNFDFWND